MALLRWGLTRSAETTQPAALRSNWLQYERQFQYGHWRFFAYLSNTSGSNNTAVGSAALEFLGEFLSEAAGHDNIAIGYFPAGAFRAMKAPTLISATLGSEAKWVHPYRHARDSDRRVYRRRNHRKMAAV